MKSTPPLNDQPTVLQPELIHIIHCLIAGKVKASNVLRYDIYIAGCVAIVNNT